MKRTREPDADAVPPHDDLASLGYAYIPGPTGSASDWVLRQLSAPTKGFAWRGQEHYDALGAAATRWVRGALCGLCDLEPLTSSSAVPYATRGLKEHTGPLCLFVCGSAPGGDAGVWGRSLCINSSTTEGAMFEYCLRAKALGWAVLIADPHAAESPHMHLVQLWREVVLSSACSSVALVAHSYGAPLAVHLLKAEPSALSRVVACALTDGMAWGLDGWEGTFEKLLCEEAPEEEEAWAAGVKAQAARQRRYKAAAPLAFSPASPAVQASSAPSIRLWQPPLAHACQCCLSGSSLLSPLNSP